jgi:hypothetical protein
VKRQWVPVPEEIKIKIRIGTAIKQAIERRQRIAERKRNQASALPGYLPLEARLLLCEIKQLLREIQ